MRFRSIIFATVLAVLAIAIGITVQGTSFTQADGTKQPPKQEKVRPADFDGEVLATCDHPADKEKKAVKVKRHFLDPTDGKVKEKVEDGELVDEVVLISEACGNAPATAELSAMATSTTIGWTCYGKQELNTLLGNNWRLKGWQSYRTNSYYGNLLWPPYTPIIDTDAGLGWSTKSEKITGPEIWSTINGFPYKGTTVFQATFEYKLGGWLPTLDTDSPAFRLVYGHNSCRKYTL